MIEKKYNALLNNFKLLKKHKLFTIVDGYNTVEILNVNYAIKAYNDLSIIHPATLEDLNERNNILNFFLFGKGYEYFDKDLHTRKAVFQPKYENDKNLASCISCIQAIVRFKVLHLHIFVRSQNFNKNFLYDNLTYQLLMNNLSQKLKVKQGKIYVKITSLHQIL